MSTAPGPEWCSLVMLGVMLISDAHSNEHHQWASLQGRSDAHYWCSLVMLIRMSITNEHHPRAGVRIVRMYDWSLKKFSLVSLFSLFSLVPGIICFLLVLEWCSLVMPVRMSITNEHHSRAGVRILRVVDESFMKKVSLSSLFSLFLLSPGILFEQIIAPGVMLISDARSNEHH